jgi:hypothetical protein
MKDLIPKKTMKRRNPKTQVLEDEDIDKMKEDS